MCVFVCSFSFRTTYSIKKSSPLHSLSCRPTPDGAQRQCSTSPAPLFPSQGYFSISADSRMTLKIPSSVPSDLHSLNPDHLFFFFTHRVIAQEEKVGSKTNSYDSRSLDSPGVARRRWQPLFLNALNYIVASAARLCIPNQT